MKPGRQKRMSFLRRNDDLIALAGLAAIFAALTVPWPFWAAYAVLAAVITATRVIRAWRTTRPLMDEARSAQPTESPNLWGGITQGATRRD
jgi:hypothetical protein